VTVLIPLSSSQELRLVPKTDSALAAAKAKGFALGASSQRATALDFAAGDRLVSDVSECTAAPGSFSYLLVIGRQQRLAARRTPITGKTGDRPMKKTLATALTVAVLAGSAFATSTTQSQAGYYGGHYGGGYGYVYTPKCFWKKVKVHGYYGWHWKKIRVCH
jgi:hypothetical protein